MDGLHSSGTDPIHLAFAGTSSSFLLGEAELGWVSAVLKGHPQQLISEKLLCLILYSQVKRRKRPRWVSEPSHLVNILLIAVPKYSPLLLLVQLGTTGTSQSPSHFHNLGTAQ